MEKIIEKSELVADWPFAFYDPPNISNSNPPPINYQTKAVTMKGYKDYAHDPVTDGRNRANTWFVNRLFDMLENADSDGISGIICWQPHGRCFIMRDQAKLNDILPKYFKVTKTSSFLRQLNIYGFSRIARGPDRGGYYHEMFLQNKRWLAQRITPIKVKGTGVRTKAHQEPSFWEMEWVNSSKASEILPSSTMTRSMSVVSHDTKEEEDRAEATEEKSEELKECTEVAPVIVKIKKFSEVASPLSSPQEIFDDNIEELLEMVGSKPFLHEFVLNGNDPSLPFHKVDSRIDTDIIASYQDGTQVEQEDPTYMAAPDLSANDLELFMDDFQDESVGLGFDAFLQSYEDIC